MHDRQHQADRFGLGKKKNRKSAPDAKSGNKSQDADDKSQEIDDKAQEAFDLVLETTEAQFGDRGDD